MPLVALVLELDGDGAERVSDALLACGAQSVSGEDAHAGTRRERAVFDEPGERSPGWSRVRLRALIDARLEPGRLLERACVAASLARVPPYSLERVEDEDWVRKSRSQFAPIRITPRLWIVPSWRKAPDPGAINIVLDPGGAFGTGSHPTTRSCLAWLAREVRGGETVLDYGCGSGILAIAARKLGAARAVGVDIDPAAIAAARENAARNGADCQFVDARAPLALRARLVVANILANPLKLLAAALARHAAPGARIALAGILDAQAGEVAAAYAPWFDMEEAERAEGWTLLCGMRKAGAARSRRSDGTAAPARKRRC